MTIKITLFEQPAVNKIIMPKSTAVWLLKNTKLTFDQIAVFCGLSIEKIKAMEDEEFYEKLPPSNPIQNGQLTREEITRCENDHGLKLQLSSSWQEFFENTTKSQKKIKQYVSPAMSENRPHAILWLVRHYPGLNDNQIARLVGSTAKTVLSIRDKTHWNITNLTPKDPVLLGICTQEHLFSMLQQAGIDLIKKEV
jgi:hypothetical protein